MAVHTAFVSTYLLTLSRRKRHVTHCAQRSQALYRTVACIQHVYPVEVELGNGSTVYGASFCVSPGEFLTCFHVVAHAMNIIIAGRSAYMLRACRAADIALLSCSSLAASAGIQALTDDEIPHSVLQFPSKRSKRARNRASLKPVMGVRDRLYPMGSMLPTLVVGNDDGMLGPGDSGSPLYDAVSGKVAGMFAATAADADDTRFAYVIPVSFLRRVLQDSERVIRLGALPGLVLHSLTLPLVRRAAAIPEHIDGLRVAAGGNLYGLHESDVICAVGGVPVSSDTSFSGLLARFEPRESVEITLWRTATGIEQMSVKLRDAERAASAVGLAPGRVAVSGNGFVFMVLSFEYLAQWGWNWHQKCPPDLLTSAMRIEEGGRGGTHKVVLAVAPVGYEELLHKTVETMGGRQVSCLVDMVRFSRQRSDGSHANSVVRLHGGVLVDVGPCVIERGRLDPQGAAGMEIVIH